MASIMDKLATPNVNGVMMIGDPMDTAPTTTADFLYVLTNAEYGTSNIQRENDIQTADLNIYGTKNVVSSITAVKVTYTVTQYVAVDVTPESWYMRIRLIGKNPTDVTANTISFLTRGIDPLTGDPIEGDYFCPEATISVNNDIDFGEAGSNREVEVTIQEVLPGEIIAVIPDTAPSSGTMSPSMEEYMKENTRRKASIAKSARSIKPEKKKK